MDEDDRNCRNCLYCDSSSTSSKCGCCYGYSGESSNWTPKEKVMESKLDFKAACEAIDKVSEEVICSSGKKAVKEIIGALCGEKFVVFDSNGDSMEVSSDGDYKVKGRDSAHLCYVRDGMLGLNCSVNREIGIKTGVGGKIVVRGPVTVLRSDGTTIDVE